MTCLACGLVCLHFIDIILLLTFSLSPVFTKCKDNLENGRRLENLSWRLWYRESLIEKAKEQHVRTPIPIQHSNAAEEDYFTYASSTSTSSTCSIPQTPRSLKHVSPSSFKRMISSLNTPIEPYPLPTVSQSNHKSNTITAAPATTLVERASKNDAIVPPPSPPPSATSQHQHHQLLPNNHHHHQQQQQQAKPPHTHTSKFYLSDEEEDEDEEEDTVHDVHDGADDDGFWSTVRSNDTDFILNDTCKKPAVSTIPPAKENPSTETNKTSSSTLPKNPFQKRIPPKIADHPPQQSLLTTMLVSKSTTPMVRPRRIIHSSRRGNKYQPCPPFTNDMDLSQSLRYCVDWEQRQNNTCTAGGSGLDSRVADDHPSILTSSYWESFQGW